jgi:hypothetical protein
MCNKVLHSIWDHVVILEDNTTAHVAKNKKSKIKTKKHALQLLPPGVLGDGCLECLAALLEETQTSKPAAVTPKT